MPAINVKLSDDEHAAIKAIADEKGLNLSDTVRSVLKDHFSEKPKPKGWKTLFGAKTESCDHPPSRHIHDSFGVHCDICKTEL